jgi:hypothetical protein
MVGFLAASVLTLSLAQEGRMFVILEPGGKEPRLVYSVPNDRMETPKLSPKKFGDPPTQWQFDWIVSAFGLDPTGLTQNKELRFRVYSQEHKTEGDKAPLVARMALRLWDLNFRKLRLNHNSAHNRGIVDFYLCWGGKAGGEQLIDHEIFADGRDLPVNTIYIYHLSSFKDPVQMAREVAHEYGHAVLPAVGGFKTPEDWANGYLGEKMFMRWLRDEIQAGRMYTDDAMMSDPKALDGWVKTNVDPLVTRAALTAPNVALLNDQGPAAMDAYLGLALYAESILPGKVFGRSLKLTGSDRAGDYPNALVTAVEEAEAVTLSIPALLKNQPLWVPLGKGKLSGAQVVKKQGDWALVKPTVGLIVISNPH